MSSSSTHLPTPEGPGSVSGAPNLPEGFTDTFTSRYIDTAGLHRRLTRMRYASTADSSLPAEFRPVLQWLMKMR